jgi:subtilisin
MNIRKLWPLLAFIAVFWTASSAYAASDDSRYLIKSGAQFWKKSLTVRHVFENGFTADLSDWQLRLTKIFGVDIEPVKKLNILDDVFALKDQTANQTPTENVPWGVKVIYGDSMLKKTSGGDEVNVAILDTGIIKHSDLAANIKGCKDFSTAKPMVDGKCDDKNGHGTHIAGIVAANGGSGGEGIWGVAPGASILAFKACSNLGTCWADDVAVAIRTAVDDGANVINISLGSDIGSSLVAEAIGYAVSKDVLVIAASGNDGPYPGSIDYPAGDTSVIAVGAIDFDMSIPEWAARGLNDETKLFVKNAKDIDFVAPGLNIESTWKDGGYVILSGTSMSAPHIAGLAAKLWQKDAKNPAEATKALLIKFSQDILPLGDDDASGWGLPKIK